jgi:flagellar basal-body rod protein FlgG
MRSLQTAATGMLAQQMMIEVTAHNLANQTNDGYKKERLEFETLMYQTTRRVGTSSNFNGGLVPSGIMIGLGVKPSAVYRILEVGSPKETRDPYHMMIQGTGFFPILIPSSGQIAYQRAGNFQRSSEGTLVTGDGYPLLPEIIIPSDAENIHINDNGIVSGKVKGTIDEQVFGRIELANFINPNGLEPIGNNLFVETKSSGTANMLMPGNPGCGAILQGYVESSNVSSIIELTGMIEAQRAYDMNSRVVTKTDEMLKRMVDM